MSRHSSRELSCVKLRLAAGRQLISSAPVPVIQLAASFVTGQYPEIGGLVVLGEPFKSSYTFALRIPS